MWLSRTQFPHVCLRHDCLDSVAPETNHEKSSFWNRVATVAALALFEFDQPCTNPDRPNRGGDRASGSHRQRSCRRCTVYIDSINARGGIRGEKIELITLDDKFDPKLAAANASTMILEKTALFMNRGTPYADANANCLPVKRIFKFPELFNTYSLFYFRREVFKFFKIAR